MSTTIADRGPFPDDAWSQARRAARAALPSRWALVECAMYSSLPKKVFPAHVSRLDPSLGKELLDREHRGEHKPHDALWLGAHREQALCHTAKVRYNAEERVGRSRDHVLVSSSKRDAKPSREAVEHHLPGVQRPCRLGAVIVVKVRTAADLGQRPYNPYARSQLIMRSYSWCRARRG